MRISDWSSDVCSSDLLGQPGAVGVRRPVGRAQGLPRGDELAEARRTGGALQERFGEPAGLAGGDRKSVGEGKSVSVSVDLGGRSIITKKEQHIRINKT